MKKLLLISFCIALCSVLFVQPAFAADMSDLNENSTIYAEDVKTVEQAIEDDSGNLTESLNKFKVAVDADTIMPIYQASLYDFADSGAFTVEPFEFEGGQVYLAETVNSNDKFAGIAVFTVDGDSPDIHIMAPTTEKTESVDFKTNAKRINSLLNRKSFDTENFDAKLVWVDGLGYAYFLSNGSEDVLIAAGLKGTNGNIFTEENGGIVAIDASLKEKANIELEKYQQQLEYLDSLEPGENPMTGASTPVFVVDNSMYESDSNGLLLTITIFALLGIAAIILRKKIFASSNI